MISSCSKFGSFIVSGFWPLEAPIAWRTFSLVSLARAPCFASGSGCFLQDYPDRLALPPSSVGFLFFQVFKISCYNTLFGGLIVDAGGDSPPAFPPKLVAFKRLVSSYGNWKGESLQRFVKKTGLGGPVSVHWRMLIAGS